MGSTLASITRNQDRPPEGCIETRSNNEWSRRAAEDNGARLIRNVRPAGLARDLTLARPQADELQREHLRATIASMPSNPLTELLKLPAGDRADLAMVLWESLDDEERGGQLRLSEVDRAELDRRWAEHLQNPGSGVAWSVVRSKLRG